MTSEDRPTDRAAAGAQADTPIKIALARAAAGEILGPTDIKAIFHLKHSQYTKLNNQGAFDHLKLRPAIGPKCFSGHKVARYLAGESMYEPAAFGRKRASR